MHIRGRYSVAKAHWYLGIPWTPKYENKHNHI